MAGIVRNPATVSGNFTATGQSATFRPRPGEPFNVTIGGTVTGSTIGLERSFDDGVTWHPLTIDGAGAMEFTAVASESWIEYERGVDYRLNCTVYGSGTTTYRLSQ